MRVTPRIDFDDGEREALVRALTGHEHLFPEPGKKAGLFRYPVRAHLARLSEHEEPYDLPALGDLDGLLFKMLSEWQPQTDASWWREQGATGSDEAVEGLAQERRHQVTAAGHARLIVAMAEDLIVRVLRWEETRRDVGIIGSPRPT